METTALLIAGLLVAPPLDADDPQPNENSTPSAETASPVLDAANSSPLGLRVRSVEVDTGTEHYRLTEQTWGETVATNPELALLNERSKLFAPGIVATTVGSVWLTIAAASMFDRERRRARERADPFSDDEDHHPAIRMTFAFVFPAAITAVGIGLTSVGLRARRQLHLECRRYFLAPQASRSGGGVVLGGRF